MITDGETDFVFISDRLQTYRDFFDRLRSSLCKNKVRYGLLPCTRDVWTVDYMPVQVDANRFVQFRFEPDYLQNKYSRTQTDPSIVCTAIGLKPIASDIKLDGGNVVRGKNWVILTDKIFKENPGLEKRKLVAKLENTLGVRCIIIPAEPGDFTGHADGMVRYYDNKTVLINNYRKGDKPEFQTLLRNRLRESGLSAIAIPYNPYENATSLSAAGLYINFLQMKDLILLPAFCRKEDELAFRQFEQLFPRITIANLDSREIAREGGVLHCISWPILRGGHDDWNKGHNDYI